jgi:hypothetical protein
VVPAASTPRRGTRKRGAQGSGSHTGRPARSSCPSLAGRLHKLRKFQVHPKYIPVDEASAKFLRKLGRDPARTLAGAVTEKKPSTAAGPGLFDDPYEFLSRPHPRQGVLLPRKSRIRMILCRHQARHLIGRMDEPRGYIHSRQVQWSGPGDRLVPQIEVWQCTKCGMLFAEECWTHEIVVDDQVQRSKLPR